MIIVLACLNSKPHWTTSPTGARTRIARGEAPLSFAIVGHSPRPRVAGGECSVGRPTKYRRRSSVPAAQGGRRATPSFNRVSETRYPGCVLHWVVALRLPPFARGPPRQHRHRQHDRHNRSGLHRARHSLTQTPATNHARSARGRRFRRCLARRVRRHAPRQLRRPRPPRAALAQFQHGTPPPSGRPARPQ